MGGERRAGEERRNKRETGEEGEGTRGILVRPTALWTDTFIPFLLFFFTLPASLCTNNALAPLSTHTCTRAHTKYRKYLITAVEGVL